MWPKKLGLRTYFILKHIFSTATIFTSFASTVHKSLKIILRFQVLSRLLYMLVNATYSVSGSLNSTAVKP